MSPILHCIRHGQGVHNLGAGHYTIRDPMLTKLGVEQCKALQTTFFQDSQCRISLIAASPLCRALHTASVVFNPALAANEGSQAKILALPDVQETSDDPCDTGLDLLSLHEVVKTNHWPVDLSHVPPGWEIKTTESRYAPHNDAIRTRARDARVLLRQKIRKMVEEHGSSDVQIVLVTHGGFLHYFTDDWEECDRFPGTGWSNCEMRSYTFEGDVMLDGDEHASIVETMESRQKRGKDYPMYEGERQIELFHMGMAAWGRQGLQRPDQLAS